MKKIKEEVIKKDTTINKVQFDREWFYAVKDMAEYLNEDLSNVEYVHLPMIIDGAQENVKCATLEDIERARKKELLEDFTSSITKQKKK